MVADRDDSFADLADGEAVPTFDEAQDPPGSDPGGFSSQDLFEDVEALIEDGFNYFDAELAFQKTRASFVGDRIVKTIVFGLIAVVIALLAAVALVVGLIVALTPLITAWGATAIVVGVLVGLAALMVNAARKAISGMKSAIVREPKPGSDENA